MLFNSPIFLFCFLPVIFLAHHLVPKRARNALILLGSLVFYSWAEPRFIFVVILSSLLDWWVVGRLPRAASNRGRQALVAAGVIANVAMLAWFKYANFFFENFSLALARLGISPLGVAPVALPIAISFIVFEKITYVVDNYRGVGRPARSFADYLLYVMFFPKLMAGPIIKYHDIEPQIQSRSVSWDDFIEGSLRFIVGLGKKLLIADNVAPLANEIFSLPASQLSMPALGMGAAAFAVQILFDFSGYSDMAIGLARSLGFRLLENFQHPYTSQNFTEFWRRWHISLSTWIRDYLYIPLGGNRLGKGRAYLNLWICFLASGIWHGANWTFVIWGAFHGLMLVADKLFWLEWQKRFPRWCNVGITFGLVCFSWLIFRAENLGRLAALLGGLSRVTGPWPILSHWAGEAIFAMSAGLLLAFLPLAAWWQRISVWISMTALGGEIRLAAAFCLFVLALSKMANNTFQSFLYFRF